jgi:hypothetical protein
MMSSGRPRWRCIRLTQWPGLTDDYGLTVEVRQEPGHMLATVAGEVDIATGPQLQQRLAAPAAGQLDAIAGSSSRTSARCGASFLARIRATITSRLATLKIAARPKAAAMPCASTCCP